MGKCIDSRGTRRQSGAAVLIILILAGVLGVVFFVNTMSLVPGNRDRDAATRLALQQAKEALIGYAVTYMDTHINDVPGYLPCPESTGPLDPTPPNREGAEAGNCGAKGLNAIGRLPWYSLDIPPPRDGHGECLWYAVSGTFKANVKPDVLNWDSVGRFHIQIPNGPTPPNVADDVDRVVAVVIAPGPPLLNQTRTADANTPQCPGNRVIANYLEDVNATMTTNGNANFLAGTPGSRVINDQFITITSNEIFNALAKRDEFRANLRGFARSVSQCLATFRNVAPADPNGRLPWAASLSAATIPDLASTNYTDISSLRVGRVPFILDDSFTQTRGASNANPLLPIAGASAHCQVWPSKYDAWWNNWKDQLMYAISAEFSPAQPTTAACSSTCLTVNGAGQYAGIVILTGRAIGLQQRWPLGVRGLQDFYLEDRNLESFQIMGLDFRSSSSTSTFNDVLTCIRTDLVTVDC